MMAGMYDTRTTGWQARLILLAGLVLMMTAGCGTTPTQQAYSARVLVNEAMAEAVALYDADAVSAEQMTAVKAAKDKAIPLLDKADIAAESNVPLSYEFARMAANAAIDEVLRRVAELRRGN